MSVSLFNRNPASHIERISNDLRDMAEEVQGMVKSLGKEANGISHEMKSRLTEIASSASDAGQQLQRQVKKSARAVDQTVHERPYQFMAAAFGIGLLFGLLKSR